MFPSPIRFLRASAGWLVLLSLFTWAAPPVAAQGAGSVRGTVTRAPDGTPVAGVAVSIAGRGITAISGSNGRYTLPRVPEGSQTLVFRLFGYAPREVAVTVATGVTQELNVTLEEQAVTLGEVVIETASRAPERVVEAPAAVSVIPPAAARNVSLTGQVPVALNTVPGVDVVQSGMNDFNVNARGFNSSLNRRVLALQDGRDLAIAFLGAQEWNALSSPLEDLGRIEMVRGPGSALYGANAFSGVLSFTTPAAREVVGTKLTLGGGELGTLRGDLRHAGVIGTGRWGYRLNAGYYRSESWSRSRTRFDSTALRQEYANATDSVVPLTREPRALNGQGINPADGSATGEPDDLLNTYGSARIDYYMDNGSVFTVDGGAAQVENEVFVTGIGRVQVSKAVRPWARLAWAANRFNLMAWYSGRNSLDPQYSLRSGAGLEEKSDIYHVEGQYNRRFSADRARLVVGASYRNYAVNTLGTLMAPPDDDRSDAYYSGYGQLEYKITPWLRAVAAARLDDGDLFDTQFSPKGALVWSPSESHALRFTVNRAFQLPNYSEFYLRAAAAPPTTSPRTLELGLESYFAAVSGAPLPPAVTAGLNLTPLPWNFDPSTQALALGNSALDVEKVTGWELGYKGNIARRGFVTLDLYLNELKNFVTDLLPAVNSTYPAYALTDGGRDVPTTLNTLDARLAAIGLPPTHPLRAPIPLLRGGYTALNAQAGPLLATLPSGSRALVVSYTNAGRVIERGVELGFSYELTEGLRFDGSYAFFDFDVKSQQLGDQLLPNTPEHKGALALSYQAAQGFDGSVSVRLVDSYRWAAGVFSGFVPSTQTVNVSAGYRLTNNFRVHGAVTNLFDQQRFHLYGGSVLGRRMLGGITATF